MKTLKITIVTLAAALTVAIVSVVALAAPTSVTPQGTAAAAEYCPPGERARRQASVNRYQRGILKARKAYYRKHRKLKDRRAFVKKQNAQLAALKRHVRRCN